MELKFIDKRNVFKTIEFEYMRMKKESLNMRQTPSHQLLNRCTKGEKKVKIWGKGALNYYLEWIDKNSLLRNLK